MVKQQTAAGNKQARMRPEQRQELPQQPSEAVPANVLAAVVHGQMAATCKNVLMGKGWVAMGERAVHQPSCSMYVAFASDSGGVGRSSRSPAAAAADTDVLVASLLVCLPASLLPGNHRFSRGRV
jgi:hypothetical protein